MSENRGQVNDAFVLYPLWCVLFPPATSAIDEDYALPVLSLWSLLGEK